LFRAQNYFLLRAELGLEDEITVISRIMQRDPPKDPDRGRIADIKRQIINQNVRRTVIKEHPKNFSFYIAKLTEDVHESRRVSRREESDARFDSSILFVSSYIYSNQYILISRIVTRQSFTPHLTHT